MKKKTATIIQTYNDVLCDFEYSVKGYDVTESIKILLKRHKEEYDKHGRFFAKVEGFNEATNYYKKEIDVFNKVVDLLLDKKNYYKFVNETSETIDIQLAIIEARKELENEEC